MPTPINNRNSMSVYLEPKKTLVTLFVFSKNKDYPKDYLNMNTKTIF